MDDVENRGSGVQSGVSVIQYIDKLEESNRLLIGVVDYLKCDSCAGSLAAAPKEGCESIFHCGSAQIVRDAKVIGKK